MEGYITGIKFYDGFLKVASFMPVRLVREPGNHHDCDALLAVLETGTVLGHLDKKSAAILAPLMDINGPLVHSGRQCLCALSHDRTLRACRTPGRASMDETSL